MAKSKTSKSAKNQSAAGRPTTTAVAGGKPPSAPSSEVPQSKPAKSSLDYEIALDKIRDLILMGETFKQGHKLIEKELSGLLNPEAASGSTQEDDQNTIGTVSIRRALNSLQYEGLVEIHPQFGTFVATIGEDDLYQLWRTRVILEEFFVTTIARDARPFVSSGVQDARDINDEMEKLLAKSAKHWSHTVAESIRLDILFHEHLASAAGYPLLKKELITVRRRLRLAAGRMDVTLDQLRGIVLDHKRILDAIRPKVRNADGFRPFGDVAEAKLAINSHLRNAADRLNITARIRHNAEYGGDPIWDLPRQLPRRDAVQDSALNSLRILLELVVAAVITKQDIAAERLLVPQRVCGQMSDIAMECEGKSEHEIDIQTKSQFISLDMQFHASLAFLSGLLFAGEAIVHLWQHLYDDAQARLSGKKMASVVDDHRKILKAVTFYSGNTDEPRGIESVLKHVKDHLIRAYSSDSEKLGPIAGKRKMDQEVLDYIEWFSKKLASG